MIRQSIPPNYTRQDSELTVSQALDEFYQRNPKAVRQTGDGLRDNFFRSHDTIHVVFGCDTTIHDEALADMWTIFGSDLGFRNYLKYLGPLQEDLKDILAGAGTAELLSQSLKALPDAFSVVVRSRSMRKKWRWLDHQEFLNRPLKDVRDELNIEVIS